MVSFSSNKILAGIGSILYGSIIGIILVLIGMKGISEHYQDRRIYSGLIMGSVLLIIGTILHVAGGLALLFSVLGVSLIGSSVYDGYGGYSGGFYDGTAGASILLLIGVVVICFIVGFILDLLAVRCIKNCFHALSDRSGNNLFHTAGTLIWIGAILTIIGIGFFLIWIGFIVAAVGFFTLDEKPAVTGNYAAPPYGYNTSSPSYGYTPPPQQTQQPSTSTGSSKANFCPNCGAPVKSGATFCANCGKQI
ncbi:MAG: DUF996 domain-containing protein [Nitrososphaerota archaeon]|jgi:uncharacterized membrane protein|nr:DUF996 domain-containing protein [Nitrososphaerota archaeon]